MVRVSQHLVEVAVLSREPANKSRQSSSWTPPVNPFATRFIRPGAIPLLFSANESLELWQSSWQAAGRRGQLVGPHGSGKSTLMEWWARSLVEQSIPVQRVTLTAQRPRPLQHTLFDWSSVTPETVAMIDGYEQLTWMQRWRIKSAVRARRA